MSYRRYLISLLINLIIIIFPAFFYADEFFVIVVNLIIWFIISIPTVIINIILRKYQNEITIICFSSGLPLLLCGFLFKIMHWPGALIQTSLGFILLFVSVIGLFLVKNK